MTDIPPGTPCRTKTYEGGFKTPPLYGRDLVVVKKNKDGCYTVKSVETGETAVVPKKGIVVMDFKHHCPECQKRGQPKNYISPVRCAFPKPDQVFTPENWSCVTAVDLRDQFQVGIPEVKSTWDDISEETDLYIDVTTVVLSANFKTLHLRWYKTRGSIMVIEFINQQNVAVPANYADIKKVMGHFKKACDDCTKPVALEIIYHD